MNAEAATAAQVSFIRKLQSDQAWHLTIAAPDWDAERSSEARSYSRCLEIARYASKHGSDLSGLADADIQWLVEGDFDRSGSYDVKDLRAHNRARAELWADRRIASRKAGRAEFLAALTVDPTGLSKREASALIDLLK